jgi:hypothetical protein
MTAERVESRATSQVPDHVANYDRLWWHVRLMYAILAALTVCLFAVSGTMAAVYFLQENQFWSRERGYLAAVDIDDDVTGTGIPGMRWARDLSSSSPPSRQRQWHHQREGNTAMKSNNGSMPTSDVTELLVGRDDDANVDDDHVGGRISHAELVGAKTHRPLKMGHRKKRSEKRRSSKTQGPAARESDEDIEDIGDDEDVDAEDATEDIGGESQSGRWQGPRGRIHHHQGGDDVSDGREPPASGSNKDGSGLWLTTYSKIPVNTRVLFNSFFTEPMTTPHHPDALACACARCAFRLPDHVTPHHGVLLVGVNAAMRDYYIFIFFNGRGCCRTYYEHFAEGMRTSSRTNDRSHDSSEANGRRDGRSLASGHIHIHERPSRPHLERACMNSG